MGWADFFAGPGIVFGENCCHAYQIRAFCYSSFAFLRPVVLEVFTKVTLKIFTVMLCYACPSPRIHTSQYMHCRGQPQVHHVDVRNGGTKLVLKLSPKLPTM